MEVYVYKTNIAHKEMLSILEPVLSQQEEINQWSVDIEDCDNILRIVSEEIVPEEHYMNIIHAVGFECELLP